MSIFWVVLPVVMDRHGSYFRNFPSMIHLFFLYVAMFSSVLSMSLKRNETPLVIQQSSEGDQHVHMQNDNCYYLPDIVIVINKLLITINIL